MSKQSGSPILLTNWAVYAVTEYTETVFWLGIWRSLQNVQGYRVNRFTPELVSDRV